MRLWASRASAHSSALAKPTAAFLKAARSVSLRASAPASKEIDARRGRSTCDKPRSNRKPASSRPNSAHPRTLPVISLRTIPYLFHAGQAGRLTQSVRAPRISGRGQRSDPHAPVKGPLANRQTQPRTRHAGLPPHEDGSHVVGALVTRGFTSARADLHHPGATRPRPAW